MTCDVPDSARHATLGTWISFLPGKAKSARGGWSFALEKSRSATTEISPARKGRGIASLTHRVRFSGRHRFTRCSSVPPVVKRFLIMSDIQTVSTQPETRNPKLETDLKEVAHDRVRRA